MEDKEKIVSEAEEVKTEAAEEAKEAAPVAEEPKAEVKAEPKKKGGKLGIIIAAAVVAVVLVAGVVLAFLSGNQAITAFKGKKYEDAYSKTKLALFMSAKDKNLIAEKYVLEVLCPEGKYYEGMKVLEASKMTEKEKTEVYSQNGYLGLCKAGQVVKFGQYETDGDAANGPEDLEWVVMDVYETGGKAVALIMTKDVVGTCGGWNRGGSNNTFYAQSQLNEWCNVDFFNDFTKYDVTLKNKLLMKTVSTEDSTGGVDSGEDVKVVAYAPSTQEIEKYLTGDLAQYKKAGATTAAAKEGVTAFGKEKTSNYFVRNIGNNTDGAQWAAGYDKEGVFQEGMSMSGSTTGCRVCVNVYLGEVK